MPRTKRFHGVSSPNHGLFSLPDDILCTILAMLVENHTDPRKGLIPLMLTHKATLRFRFKLFRNVVRPFLERCISEVEPPIHQMRERMRALRKAADAACEDYANGNDDAYDIYENTEMQWDLIAQKHEQLMSMDFDFYKMALII